LAGIYIHIPFCRKACHYCNFHFSTSLRLKNAFLEALLKEIDLTKGKRNHRIGSVYLGGGTPSLLEVTELERIMLQLKSDFDIMPDAEITMEANPDDINPTRLSEWRNAGINRLSIGIQSFREDDLKWMNRSHSAEQATSCIEMSQQAGFQNLSIDLIYGTPGLDMDSWVDNISRAMSMNIPHLSCYALTVEPSTPLHALIQRKKKEEPDAGTQAEQFLKLMDMADAAGYEHYEISNFSLPGMHSRHNSSYWQGLHYFGFGPSAHSFDGSERRWNIADNAAYIKALAEDRIPSESETLTVVQHMNEYVMTSLRTSGGIDLERISDTWGKEESDRILRESTPHAAKSLINLVGSRLVLTRQGKLFADGIAGDLFRSA
jgi:oxygen-independent coproporphyrinogen-3 oxidase